jgi:hypothetical protein
MRVGGWEEEPKLKERKQKIVISSTKRVKSKMR